MQERKMQEDQLDFVIHIDEFEMLYKSIEHAVEDKLHLDLQQLLSIRHIKLFQCENYINRLQEISAQLHKRLHFSLGTIDGRPFYNSDLVSKVRTTRHGTYFTVSHDLELEIPDMHLWLSAEAIIQTYESNLKQLQRLSGIWDAVEDRCGDKFRQEDNRLFKLQRRRENNNSL
jgi:hypothetical protein